MGKVGVTLTNIVERSLENHFAMNISTCFTYMFWRSMWQLMNSLCYTLELLSIPCSGSLNYLIPLHQHVSLSL